MPFWKPRPRALDKQDRDAKRAALDEHENKEVRIRSEGRCEVIVDGGRLAEKRCRRRAFHIHHMVSGWGRRARGPSLLAQHKQHVCAQCHDLITRHLLARIFSESMLGYWTDHYRRVS